MGIKHIANKFQVKLAQHSEEVDAGLKAKVLGLISDKLGLDMSLRVKFLMLRVMDGKVFIKFAFDPAVKHHPQFHDVLKRASNGKDLPTFVLNLAKEASGAVDGEATEIPWS